MSGSRRPMLIGASQLTLRDQTLEAALSPLDMLERVAREAAASSRAVADPLAALDTVALTDVFAWAPRNGPRLLAERIGARPAHEQVCPLGGETPVALLNRTAERIRRGECDLAFLGGCNNMRTIGLARKAGVRLDWPQGGTGQPTSLGASRRGTSEAEDAVGLELPIAMYPLFENALRAARGQDLATHRRAMGALFHPFTRVAASNPHAWFPVERSAEELTTPTAANRMIGFPYPKYLNAVMTTDQAAGVLVASEEAARRLGVPEAEWVHWRGGAFESESPWFVSERPSFAEAPALRRCHLTALARAGLALDEIDLFDLYSCFPVAVAMACEMLGLAQDDPRGLTLTGGLPYAGGPGNGYCLHSLAAAWDALRSDRGRHALVTGNGWYLTKHAATILSREPEPTPEESPKAVASDDWSAPPVVLRSEAEGEARIETFTVLHDREGAPERGIVVGRLLATEERFLARTPTDRDVLEALESREAVGAPGRALRVGDAQEFRPA